MTQFEGELEIFCEGQMKFIEKVLEEHGFENAVVKAYPLGKKGDNYASNVARIIATEEGKEPFKFVAKIAPRNEVVRKQMTIDKLFLNEYIMYTEVLSEYKELFEKTRIPQDERLRIADLYGFLSDAPNESMLIEDLSDSGFVLLNKATPLSSETAKIILKTLAVIHSMSYVFKIRYPQKFKSIQDRLYRGWSSDVSNEQLILWLETFEEDVICLMSDDKYKKALKGACTDLPKNSVELLEYSATSKYSVITHGDCWINNALFRLEGQKPVEVVLIDYQMSKVTSPAEELLNFIFLSTEYSTRKVYFTEWIDFYYTQLEYTLCKFGLDAQTVLTRRELDEELKKCTRFALGYVIPAINLHLRDGEEAIDFTEGFTADGDVMEAMDQFRIKTANASTQIKMKEKIEGIIETIMEIETL